MANILISFTNVIEDESNPIAMPAFYESFIKGMLSFGHKVLAMGISWKNLYIFSTPCPSNLLEKIKEFKPDLIILFNNNGFNFIHEFDVPIVIFEVDSLLYYGNKDRILKNPNKYKYIVPQLSSLEILKTTYNITKENLTYIPFFTSILAKKEQINNNIIFIGSKFVLPTDNCFFKNFFLSNPSEEDLQKMLELLYILKKYMFTEEEEILLSKIPITLKRLTSNIFSDLQRVKVLSEVSDLGLRIYGTVGWQTDLAHDPLLALAYRNKKVYSLHDNEQAYNSAKIGININHVQAISGFSWRVCDIMASNACLVSEEKSDLKKLFPNIPIPTFKTADEARKICIELLTDEDKRLSIVSQCQSIIEKKYRFKDFIRRLERFLCIPLCKEKENTANIDTLENNSQFNYINLNIQDSENE